MKLTKREKILLGVLILVLFWYFVFNFAVFPLINSIGDTKAEMQFLEQEKQQMTTMLNYYQDIDAKIDEEQKTAKEENFFYKNIDEVFVDRTVQELAKKHNLTIQSNLIADPNTIAMDPYFADLRILSYPIRPLAAAIAGKTLEDIDGTDTAKDSQQTLPVYSNVVTADGQVEDVIAFVEDIRTLGKSVMVSGFGSSALYNSADGRFYDQITINFYFIEDFAD